MPIRNFNPFKKGPTAQDLYEQNHGIRSSTDKGFQDTNVKATTPIEIKEPIEYKLSDINDSGVYLPPSPPVKEKPKFFSRSTTSTSQSSHRSALTENEPFNISRESFDSYRRSFDISARAPIYAQDAPVRQSLDSRRNLNAYSPRPSFQDRERASFQQSRESFQRHRELLEDRFEDVGLHDEPKAQQKKRSFFSRFGDDNGEEKASNADVKPESASHRFLSGITGGRKRGQSGTGSELAPIPNERPASRNAVPVEAN